MDRNPTRYCRACGTRLARDNRGVDCTPCAKKARGLLAGPPVVPPGFWATDAMRDALSSWHIGRVIAAYRNHPFHSRPLSQAMVGRWVGITQAQLSRIETGPPIKDLDKLVQWARVLHIPAHLLWFKLPKASTQTRVPAAEGQRPAVQAASPSPAPELSASLDLAALLGGLTARQLPLPAGEADRAGIGVSPFEDMSFVDSTNLLLRLFLQLDDELGGDSLYVPLSRYVARLAVNAEKQSDGGLAAFGQLSQLTGWLALDANYHAAARRYLTTAVYVAYEADDPSLAASALSYMSLQETYRGRLAPALSLAQTAFTVGNGHLTPLTKTMLGTRLARAHAGLGNTSQCLRVVDEVQAAFGDAGQRQEPLWVSYVDEIEVAAQLGACYLDLGMTAEASQALTRALSLLRAQAPQRVRDRVHYLVRLAKCHLLDGDIEQACETAMQALALSEAIGSARVAERLTEFNDSLEPFAANQAARDFRDSFAATSSGR